MLEGDFNAIQQAEIADNRTADVAPRVRHQIICRYLHLSDTTTLNGSQLIFRLQLMFLYAQITTILKPLIFSGFRFPEGN
jgi:hypothetical protein